MYDSTAVYVSIIGQVRLKYNKKLKEVLIDTI
jgi:hypothetical protein